MVTVIVAEAPDPIVTGIAAGAGDWTVASSGSPVLEVTAGSNGRVCTVAVKSTVVVGPVSANGPIVLGSASQVCGATIGSATVTEGLRPSGPASRSGSPSRARSSTWSAGNGDTSKLIGWSAVAFTLSPSVWVGTPKAGNGATGAGASWYPVALVPTSGRFTRPGSRASTKNDPAA